MFYLLWKKEEISALIIQNTIEEKKKTFNLLMKANRCIHCTNF